jgi:hypothetical protein
VTDGPPVNGTYPLGYFNEDYEFISHPGEDDYMDIHNGRFCITPEYPNGTYAYFCTVDEQWNSAFPYAVGPTFYGSIVAAKVNQVSEPVETYTATTSVQELNSNAFTIFFASNDLLIIQANDLIKERVNIMLYDLRGNEVGNAILEQGSTISHIDCSLMYDGVYALRISNGNKTYQQEFFIKRK